MVSGRQVESGSGPIRYGMVGGGQGAFIGAVHRIAARMDNEFELVAGALSSDPKRARASAEELGLDPDRSYGSYAEMAKAEAKRADGIEAVAIVTPNNVHVPAAMAFLNAGIHVICDKPLAMTLVPVSISREPSLDEPQPASTSAHRKAGRTRMGRLFLKVRGRSRQGLIAAGLRLRNGARLAPRDVVWLIFKGLKRSFLASP